MGRFGAFSFHGTKTVTTGEGGMFVTNDDALYERVLTLSNHGRRAGQTKQFWPDVVGFKYKMSNIQAAIGCAQMERIDELIGRKRANLPLLPRPPARSARRADESGAQQHRERRLDADRRVRRGHRRDARKAPVLPSPPRISTLAYSSIPCPGLPMFEPTPENRNAWGHPRAGQSTCQASTI